MNSIGPNRAQVGPTTGENAAVCVPTLVVCIKAPDDLINALRTHGHYSLSLTDNYTVVPRLLFLLQIDPWSRRARRRSPRGVDWPRLATAALTSYRVSITDFRRTRNELHFGLHTQRMFYPRIRRNPRRRGRVPNQSCLNWSNGCHDKLPGYAELLKQYTRNTEPYQNGPATERGELAVDGE
jgi:hypothetical protein